MARHLIDDDVVPPSVTLAARRGFVRTAAQSLAGAIPQGVVAVSLTGDWVIGVVLGLASACVTAVLAGFASYLSIISRGVPHEYVAAGLED